MLPLLIQHTNVADSQQTSALSCVTVLDVDFVESLRNCVMAAL